jgi:hypothetical protein
VPQRRGGGELWGRQARRLAWQFIRSYSVFDEPAETVEVQLPLDLALVIEGQVIEALTSQSG